MTKNPLVNALTASGYIIFVSAFMSWGTRFAPKEDTIFAPIAIISLFTLSAAVMGYVFLYQPAILYFDGKKKQGAKLLLQTIGSFGLLTLIAILLMFSGVGR